MKLRSPSNEPLHIGLTSGHTLVIPANDEGVEVPLVFRREALSRGAVVPGEQIDPSATGNPGFVREEAIRGALNDMLDGGKEDDFTADGKPNLRKLNTRLGFQVSREEVDKIWDEVSVGDND
ncbi:MAG: hypothetical protein WA955_15625 [Diaphorobacter nitroreducens]|uniref:hypothetical protein n=1 Tax=Diaphorobacter nitroreducens TaxID=164759 RepID=UPI003C791F94